MGFEIKNQHRLLKRQFRSFPEIAAMNDEHWLAFVNVVNETYHQDK